MTEENENGRTAAVRRPKIVDRAEAKMFDGATDSSQPFGDQRLATGIVRRNGFVRDQCTREIENVAHAANNSRNFLSAKPRLTVPSSVTTTGRRTSAGYSLMRNSHSGSDAGDLRVGGRLRHVMPVRLTRLSQPPTFAAHDLSVEPSTRCSR